MVAHIFKIEKLANMKRERHNCIRDQSSREMGIIYTYSRLQIQLHSLLPTFYINLVKCVAQTDIFLIFIGHYHHSRNIRFLNHTN